MGAAPSVWQERLTNNAVWQRWRDAKLAALPRSADELIVEVRDPLHISSAERAAMNACCTRANMVIYASHRHDEDKQIPLAIGRQFGMTRLDGHWLADLDKVSQITPSAAPLRAGFIPYTTLPIKWHTDGYYNGPEQQIHGMVLHCVRSAADGGINGLLDHEIAWLHLRETDPTLIHALMRPDAMTIPAREDDEGIARAEVSGPVFSLAPSGRLHMRYTARTRSIGWHADPSVTAAVACLADFLNAPTAPTLRARLEPGMGLLCRNVLHDRSGFDEQKTDTRLLYRARFYDEIETPVSLQEID